MLNKYHIPGEQRAEKVQELFGAIAPRYDLINDLQSFGLHRRWKRRVMKLANVKPGDRALDLCCGTGDLTFALADAGAVATGLDFSEPMLAVARSKLSGPRQVQTRAVSDSLAPPKRGEGWGEGSLVLKQGDSSPRPSPPFGEEREKVAGATAAHTSNFQTPTFIVGDAQKLPFPDASFDVITVGYGLRNLASWETGLAEMIRVARPGARLLVLEFGKPENALWRTMYFTYLKLCVPIFGLIFCRNASAYAYILESLKHYPAQRGVEAKMHASGLVNVRVINLLGGAMSINYGEKPA